MKKTLLLALILSACTRYVQAPAAPVAPVATLTSAKTESPAPQSLYHHAEDIFLASGLGKGAKCQPDRAAPAFDSAVCATPAGGLYYVRDSETFGFGMEVLVPPPQAEEKKPDATKDATKKK